MTDTRATVPPKEGYYGKLRNGIIELIGPPRTDGDMIYFKSVHFNFKWLENGKCTWGDGQYDIVSLISPEDMQAAASGKVERLRAALHKIDDMEYINQLSGNMNFERAQKVARQALGCSDDV